MRTFSYMALCLVVIILALHFGSGFAPTAKKAWSTPRAEDPGSTAGAIRQAVPYDAPFGDRAIARAREWVQAEVPYCGAPNGGKDYLCGGTICMRSGPAQNPAWDEYRTDCSGLVSYAWGLPAPGLRTINFAPYDDRVAVAIPLREIAAGDALNAVDIPLPAHPSEIGAAPPVGSAKPAPYRGHVMLWVGWVDRNGHARVIQESQCGAVAREGEVSFTEMADGTLLLGGDGRRFRAIRLRPELVPRSAPGSLQPSESGEVRKIR